MTVFMVYQLLSPKIPKRIVAHCNNKGIYKEIRTLFIVEDATKEECDSIIDLLNK